MVNKSNTVRYKRADSGFENINIFFLGVDDTSLDSEMGKGGFDAVDYANAKAIDLDSKEEHERAKASMKVALEDSKRYEGDIDMSSEDAQKMFGGTEEENEAARSAIRAKNKKWPKSKDDNVYIPYVISRSFSTTERANILRAFQEYTKNTCIRYEKYFFFLIKNLNISKAYEMIVHINLFLTRFFKKQRNSRRNDYINIYRGRGCHSMIGRMGARQDLSLGNGCATSVGTPIHELMHAIGNIRFTNINIVL